MSANSNTIEIKLKFLTEQLGSIENSVKALAGLKTEALSTGNVLKGALTVGGLQVGIGKLISVFNDLKQAIDLGGELSDLSARTGQTVGDLVVLQQAFTNAGIGAQHGRSTRVWSQTTRWLTPSP